MKIKPREKSDSSPGEFLISPYLLRQISNSVSILRTVIRVIHEMGAYNQSSRDWETDCKSGDDNDNLIKFSCLNNSRGFVANSHYPTVR